MTTEHLPEHIVQRCGGDVGADGISTLPRDEHFYRCSCGARTFVGCSTEDNAYRLYERHLVETGSAAA